jgi:hypothetical protein
VERAYLIPVKPEKGLRARRSPLEHLQARFTFLYPLIGGVVWRLLPRCRFMRWLMRWQTLSGWAAASRRDYDLMITRYAKDLHYDIGGGFHTLGLGSKGRGREEALAALADWDNDWKDWRLVPLAMIETPRHLVTFGRFQACGRVSGVELDREFVQVLTIRNGMVWREHDHMGDWNEALGYTALEPAAFEPHLRAVDRARRATAAAVPG